MQHTARELRVRRALRDDEDRRREFDALVARYEKKIYNLILRQIGDPDEAADLTQETFVSAYRGFSSFRGECQISTWLCQIALNHCKNRFQQRDRRQQRELFSLDAPAAPEAPPLEIPDWTHSPQRVLEGKELRRQIQEAVLALAPEYRVPIVLCDLQGHNYQEIATMMGLPLGTVKTRIHRGRLMLRRKLSPYLSH